MSQLAVDHKWVAGEQLYGINYYIDGKPAPPFVADQLTMARLCKHHGLIKRWMVGGPVLKVVVNDDNETQTSLLSMVKGWSQVDWFWFISSIEQWKGIMGEGNEKAHKTVSELRQMLESC